MKKMPLKELLRAGIIIGIFSLAFSCKEPDPPSGVVTVTDTASKAISGATIKLTSNGYKGPGTLKATATTDGQGKAYFNEFKLPAIMQVTATKVVALGDTLSGTGILRLEEGETTESKITMK